MKFRISALFSLGLVASLTGGAQAAFTGLTNGDFESPTITGSNTTFGNGSTAITGWTVINGTQSPVGSGSVDLLNTFFKAESGSQSVDLDGTGTVAAGGLSQAVTGLTVGSLYKLDFFISNNPNGTSSGVQVSYNGTTATYNHSGATFATPAYTEVPITFVATTTAFTLSFQSTDLPSDQNGIVLDNVSLTAVPEPASFAMVGLGLLVVGGVARARRRTA